MYYHTVSASDDAGNESGRAQSVQVRTEGPDQVAPAAPQNLSAVADENDFGQVTVSWNASTLDSDGGQLTGLTGYTVFRSKGSTNSFQPVATVDASTRQYVDSGLEELTTYYYTVSAHPMMRAMRVRALSLSRFGLRVPIRWRRRLRRICQRWPTRMILVR